MDRIAGADPLQAILQQLTDGELSVDMDAYRIACNPRLIMRMCDTLLATGAGRDGSDLTAAVVSVAMAVAEKGAGAKLESIAIASGEDGQSSYFLVSAREISRQEAQARADGTWSDEAAAAAQGSPTPILH